MHERTKYNTWNTLVIARNKTYLLSPGTFDAGARNAETECEPISTLTYSTHTAVTNVLITNIR